MTIPSVLRCVLAIACGGAAVTAAVGCGEVTSATGNARYTASLAGSRVKPTATRSAATGSATLERHGASLTFEIRARDFTTPITVVHLHIGLVSSETGAVVAGLPLLAQDGVIAAGRLDLSGIVTYNTFSITGDSLRALLESGTTYLDIHTAAFPGGEVRGQVVRQ